MKIVTLVENTSDYGLKPVHGLSLYIETLNHKLLFDLGPDETLFENAEKMDVDLKEIDTVIISHGHFDHGGALEKFLELNDNAKIYVQEKAFEKHYSKSDTKITEIGLNIALKEHKQIVLLDGDYKIDDELKLFVVDTPDPFYSEANDSLHSENGKDDFIHEQNLIINEHKKVLIMGCAHKGVINIMQKAIDENPEICIGGFHLFNPNNGQPVSNDLLDKIAAELSKYNIEFYTCHCTGVEVFEYLSERAKNIQYLSCGTILII